MIANRKRPLILVTRTRRQASVLAEELARIGAETILIPTIEVVPPASFATLDAAVALLSSAENTVDWVIFTSGNAVHVLMERAHSLGSVLHPKRIAAIGPATANAVNQSGLKGLSAPLLTANEFVAESLAEDLLTQAAGTPQHFLLVRAEETREVIPAVLQAAGHKVTVAAAYRNIVPTDAIPALQQLFGSPESLPDAITFTSSSTVRNLTALMESAGHSIPPSTVIASIGPITSGTLRGLGYEPTFEAAQATITSLVDALAEHFQLS